MFQKHVSEAFEMIWRRFMWDICFDTWIISGNLSYIASKVGGGCNSWHICDQQMTLRTLSEIVANLFSWGGNF